MFQGASCTEVHCKQKRPFLAIFTKGNNFCNFVCFFEQQNFSTIENFHKGMNLPLREQILSCKSSSSMKREKTLFRARFISPFQVLIHIYMSFPFIKKSDNTIFLNVLYLYNTLQHILSYAPEKKITKGDNTKSMEELWFLVTALPPMSSIIYKKF